MMRLCFCVHTRTHSPGVFTCIIVFIFYRVRVIVICLFVFSSGLQVKVKILDKNDNRPMWPAAPIEYKVSEEIPIGSLVATLKATDPDLDSTLTYTVIGGGGGDDDDNGSPLTLDARTGNVRVRKPIDRETSPRLVLPVRVSDGKHHSDTSAVFIVSNQSHFHRWFLRRTYFPPFFLLLQLVCSRFNNYYDKPPVGSCCRCPILYTCVIIFS